MKLNIQTKLLAAFGLMIVLMIAVFGVGFSGMSNLSNHTETIVKEDLVEDVAIRELEVFVLEMTTSYANFVITQHEEDLNEIEHEIAGVYEHFDKLEGLFDKKPELLKLLWVVEDEYEIFMEAGDELVLLVQSGASDAEIVHELGLLDQDALALEEDLDIVATHVEEVIVVAYDEAVQAKSSANVMAITVLIVSSIVGAGIAFWIARSISTGVKSVSAAAEELADEILPQLVMVTEAVASGDLTKTANVTIKSIEAKGKDEVGDLGRAFNSMGEQLGRLGTANVEMVKNLQEIVGQVSNTAGDVSAASEQLASAAEQAGSATQNIAEGAQGLSKGAQDQEVAVTDTVESVKQLGSAIDQIAQGAQQQNMTVESTMTTITEVSRAISDVAKNAQEAAEGSKSADDAARKGLGIVEQTVTGMAQIKEAVSEVANRVGDLGEQSAEIGKIVAVIDDIAAQTNLLALNAAIEAARAGEQGRGFAVVADEVRQLAERVTTATKEIAGLIDGVQKGVAESVKATEKGTEEVERGSQLANEAGESLNEIQAAVQAVASQIEQISAATEEVTASSDEMVKSIEAVMAITEETTAATEQMAASNDQVQEAMGSIAAISAETGASVEESSAATEELSSQVEEVVASASALGDMAGVLTSAVARFKLTTDDSKVSFVDSEKLAA